jgi:hypothetical protein
MKKILKQTIPALLLAACAASASAGVVSVGSIDKNYGSATGRGDTASTGRGSCDTLNATSITIRDTGFGCTRFSDTFNFSSLVYKNIDSLDLSLTFSKTNDVLDFGFIKFVEDWRAKIADTSAHSSKFTMDMTNSTAQTTQLFHIDASTHPDVFATIVANRRFQLWFGDEAFGANNFMLSSASLTVNGTPVPEPTGIALFAIAMLGVAAARRRGTR